MSWNDYFFVRARQNRAPMIGLNVHVGRQHSSGLVLLAGFVGGLALIASLAAPAIAVDGTITFSGKCSWYGPGFDGKKTASGERFDMKKSTAAHRKLKFGTKVLVENPRTGKTVVVRVNDRGPYAKGRILDISRGAAEKLGTLLGGVAYVDCTVLDSDAKESGMTHLMIISRESSQTCIALVPVNSSHGTSI
ncbi:MAG: septal ring lytic transglycosylase RlpA family protein [Candidatus Melainabacteria bacterium]|nr:septal ring lytic transglycosylase RlpA family protein [Candidatus Melainabacteria bacterium]